MTIIYINTTPENPGVKAANFLESSNLSRFVFNFAKCTRNMEALNKLTLNAESSHLQFFHFLHKSFCLLFILVYSSATMHAFLLLR